MADAAARREARRRKILENSENRMNRLMGKPNTTEIVVTTADADSRPSSTLSSRVVSTESLEQEREGSGDRITSQSADQSLQTADSKIHGRPPLTSVRASETHATESGSPKNLTPQETASLFQIMENMRLGGTVVVALLVRWVLSSGYGIFYFQTIFLPFALLEIGLYSFHYTYMKEVTLPHSSSLLSGALVLCGIKPELVAVYNRIMGYTTALTEDAALYLFAFVVCNSVMT